MDRRAFLKLLGAATAAAIAAPSVVVEAYAVPPLPVMAAIPRGLAYHVANSGTYFSIDRSVAMPYFGSSPDDQGMVDYD